MIRGHGPPAEKALRAGAGRRKRPDSGSGHGHGTFITNLINYLPAGRLEYKYRHELHANEVAILPYYIANLNIEYTYKERTGQYLEFPNLCFVDTLDNMGWQQVGATGGSVTRSRRSILAGFPLELDEGSGAEREDYQRHHRQPAV